MAALGTTRRGRFKGQTLIYVMLNQPLMVPEIVTAVALLIFFAAIKVATGYNGLGYLILAHSAFCVPFAYLPIRARLEGMDLTLETAAADLYASAVADLPPGDAAADGAGDRGRRDAGLHHLARRRHHHRIRQIGRSGHVAHLHAGPASPRRDARGQRDLDRAAGADVLLLTAFFLTRSTDRRWRVTGSYTATRAFRNFGNPRGSLML